MLKKVLIADDHFVLLEGLTKLLEKDFEIVGTATNGLELVSEAHRLHPDIILLDVGMPGLNGIEAGRQVRAAAPQVKLVFFTQQSDVNHMRAAFEAGASGYVSKQAHTVEVVKALRSVLKGGYYVSPSLQSLDLHNLHDPRFNPSGFFGRELTSRQREVLQLVAEGKVAKEIAAALRISVKTVEFHKLGIMRVLNLKTTAELVRYALQQGIIT